MKMVLNKRNVDRLPNEDKTYFILDRDIPGFGVRIGKKKKSFYVEKRVNGKPVRITLGSFPVMPVEQARKEALDQLALLAKGIHPRTVSKMEQQELANQTIRKELEEVLLREILETYIKVKDTELAPRTIHDYSKLFGLYFSDWLDQPAINITRDEVLQRFEALKPRCPASISGAFKKLRALFYFAQKRYRLPDNSNFFQENPVLILTEQKAWYKRRRRKTVIPRNRLGIWFQSVMFFRNRDLGSYDAVRCDYLITLLLTGLRRTEGAEIEKSWVDWQHGILMIPVDRTKGRREHRLPLSDYLWSLFRERAAISNSKYLFPSVKGKCGHVNYIKEFMAQITERSGVPFCRHDLRRTFSSIAESLGFSSYTIKRLLNHVLDSDVTGGYIVPGFDDEGLRKPIQQITDFVLKEASKKRNVKYFG